MVSDNYLGEYKATELLNVTLYKTVFLDCAKKYMFSLCFDVWK